MKKITNKNLMVLRSYALTVFFLAAFTAYGQTKMVIHFFDEPNITIPINEIQRITFDSEGSMLLKTNNDEKIYPYYDIENISFKDDDGTIQQINFFRYSGTRVESFNLCINDRMVYCIDHVGLTHYGPSHIYGLNLLNVYYSTLDSITFAILSVPNPPNGVLIDGLLWATGNVDTPGTFTANYKDYGMLYRWNSNLGWTSKDPMRDSNGGATWDTSNPTGNVWEAGNNPCPAGWRIPTKEEFESLINSGSFEGHHATDDGDDDGGLFFGDGAHKIFLPGAHKRSAENGSIFDIQWCGGFYWSSTSRNNIPPSDAYLMSFWGNEPRTEWDYQLYGMSVRCVKTPTTLSGTVKHQNLTPLSAGSVSLYKIVEQGRYPLIETVSIKSDGTYSFMNVSNGDYLIKAHPSSTKAEIATYYGNVEFWQSATSVKIENGISVSDIDITTIPCEVLEGTSTIKGIVYEDNGGKGLEPADGVDVCIIKTVNITKAAAGTTTNAVGHFGFSEVPAGSYLVTADVPGLPSMVYKIEWLEEGEEVTDIMFIILTDSVICSIKETNYDLSLLVYPNPTTGELTIELRQAQLPNGELRTAAPVGSSSAKLIKNVEIYDVMGKKLFEEKENLTVLRSYDLAVFPNGVYFVKITTETGIVTKKIIKN